MSNKITFTNSNNETITATIKFTGKKNCPNWDASANQHHVLTVRNNATKKSMRVDYWASIAEPFVENEAGCKSALYSIGMDASCVDGYTFQDFCDNLGYDSDSRKAEKVYNACKRTYERLDNVVGLDSDVYDTLMAMGD